MFQFKSCADFQKMVDAQIEETLTLDYKASPALSRDSKNIDELCKDVSAMSNSAGGQLIYGIEEDKKTHKPRAVDDGVVDEKITREWIHQILLSRIQPRIDGIAIDRIRLSDKGYGFVITVPQSLIGPHQAPDNKYYKRFELEARAMEDYEIRDILRRATTPNLEVQLSFAGGEMNWQVEFKEREDSETFFLICTVVNQSSTPANYAILEVWVDKDLKVAFGQPEFKVARIEHNTTGQSFRVHQHTFKSPPGVPVFKEAVHETHILQLPLQLPVSLYSSSLMYFETSVEGPGFSKHEEWFIKCTGGRMHLRRAESENGGA